MWFLHEIEHCEFRNDWAGASRAAFIGSCDPRTKRAGNKETTIHERELEWNAKSAGGGGDYPASAKFEWGYEQTNERPVSDWQSVRVQTKIQIMSKNDRILYLAESGNPMQN